MGLLDSSKVWTKLSELGREKGRRWCAVAYVTDAQIIDLKEGDRLIVDASDMAIKSGSTSAQELQRLLDMGVTLYSKANLHAKAYLFERDLVVGSCNLSVSSQCTLVEMGFHSSDAKDIKAAEDAFEKLVESADDINEEFVARILVLPVTPRSSEAAPQGNRIKRTKMPPSPEVPSYPPSQLYRLKEPPRAGTPEMECYVQALFEAQLGGLDEDVVGVEFKLWPRKRDNKEPFRQHMLPKNDRLRGGNGTYKLTVDGVKHFKERELDREMVEAFLKAVAEGDSSYLPSSLKGIELEPL